MAQAWSSDEDDPGCRSGDWVALIRRARIGRTNKTVALYLAGKADPDGTNVRPGIARISVECELAYNTVKASMQHLRKIGLIEVVRAATPTRPAVYRLIVAKRVLDEIEVWSPAKADLAVQRLADEHRRISKQAVIQPSARAVLDEETAPEPVDNPVEEGEIQPSARAVSDLSDSHPHVPCGGKTAIGTLQDSHPHGLLPNQTNPLYDLTHTADARSDVTAVESPAVEDPEIVPLPARCSHGIRARLRPDGQTTCAACRVGKRLAAEGSAFTTPTGTFRVVVPRGATA